MDKNTPSLDPSLKATYERVMGTNVDSTPSSSAQDTGETKVVAKGKGKRISPVLVIAAAVLFFLLYSIIWLMVFKVNLPFLPKFF